MTPACAGTTVAGRGSRALQGDDPRVCGDDTLATILSAVTGG